MLLLQMTGLSGAGKSTIAALTAQLLTTKGYKAEVIDGDAYRKNITNDLGFSKADRMANIHRLGFVASVLVKHGIIAIIAAINPYEEARAWLKNKGGYVKTVFVDCPLPEAMRRDVKGLYRRAMLPQEHVDYVPFFTGISDPYEPPLHADLVINTAAEAPETSAQKLTDYILENIHSTK